MSCFLTPAFSLLLLCFLLLCLLVDESSSRKEGRIVDGEPSDSTAWPFMAAIFKRKSEDDEPRHWCGGVIWNENTILTAAHCLTTKDNAGNTIPVDATLFTVYLGTADTSEPRDEYTFQGRSSFVHPDYSSAGLRNDVALLRLSRRIDLTPHNHADCICDPVPVGSLNASGCLALGWGSTSPTGGGSTSTLMQVTLPLLSESVCTERYPFEASTKYDPAMNLCAGYPEVGGKDTCNGDSGGPLICPLLSDSSKYSLAGLTSFGDEVCGSKAMPGYFTNVETYADWIGRTAGDGTDGGEDDPAPNSRERQPSIERIILYIIGGVIFLGAIAGILILTVPDIRARSGSETSSETRSGTNSGSKKATTKKATTGRETTKELSAKRATTKESTAKKSSAKKSTTKKSTSKKSTTKKSTSKKATTKRASTKKSASKKSATKNSVIKIRATGSGPIKINLRLPQNGTSKPSVARL